MNVAVISGGYYQETMLKCLIKLSKRYVYVNVWKRDYDNILCVALINKDGFEIQREHRGLGYGIDESKLIKDFLRERKILFRRYECPNRIGNSN